MGLNGRVQKLEAAAFPPPVVDKAAQEEQERRRRLAEWNERFLGELQRLYELLAGEEHRRLVAGYFEAQDAGESVPREDPRAIAANALWLLASLKTDGTGHPFAERPDDWIEVQLAHQLALAYVARLWHTPDETERAAIRAEWERTYGEAYGPVPYWEHWEGDRYVSRDTWLRDHGKPYNPSGAGEGKTAA